MSHERSDRRHEELPQKTNALFNPGSVYEGIAPVVDILTRNLAEPKSYSEVFDLMRKNAPDLDYTYGIQVARDHGIINERSVDNKLVNGPRFTRQLLLPGFDTEELQRERRENMVPFTKEAVVFRDPTLKSDE